MVHESFITIIISFLTSECYIISILPFIYWLIKVHISFFVSLMFYDIRLPTNYIELIGTSNYSKHFINSIY